MNRRQKSLLKILIDQEEYLTVSFLSRELSVSERTVHNDLKVIEDYLKENHMTLKKVPKKGIWIDASLTNKKILLSQISNNDETIDELSTQMRRKKIYSTLLMQNEETSLNKLSEEYMVSKTSIVQDLELIENEAQKDHLKLIRNHKGTYIEGDENNIRHALSKQANEYIDLELEGEKSEVVITRLEMNTYYRLKNIFGIDDLSSIEKIIADAQKIMGYNINELSYANLVTHILILIKRTKLEEYEVEGKDIAPKEVVEGIMNSAQYIAGEIEKQFQTRVPRREVYYIYQYLVCSGIQSDFMLLDMEEYTLDVQEKYKSIVQQLIRFVSDAIHYDLSQDKELKISLLAHLVPMMQRLKYNIMLENPLISEIKSKYSAMFSIVTMAAEMCIGQMVSEDEVGFLTIHFQASFERSMQVKRVIIICPEGIGFSRLIAHRIEKFIPSLSIAGIISLSKVKSTDFTNIDFVISTTPIKNCVRPVVLVSSFVSEYDIQDINNYLIDNAKNEKHNKLENLSEIIDSRVVYNHVKATSKDDVIHFICNKMEEFQYVSPAYKQSVYDREKIMSTELGNGIAIPHGSEDCVLKSRIAIVVLENPIIWNKYDVQLVFLIALNMKNPVQAKSYLKDLYGIMDSNSMINAIVHAESAKEIIELINE